MRWVRILIAALMTTLACPVIAGPGLDPVEALPDAGQEARARALFKELRCVVCQSESLDDSEADLARDMRKLVRTQISQGRTDEDVKAYLTGRYGDFVLLSPPKRPSTWALWFGPFALLLAVLGTVVWFMTRRRTGGLEPPLSEAEKRALAEADKRLNKS
jgi:cytochrome c-type biogenesis protein CcmH